ncbi:hypothetical protein N8K70_13080 [Microbacterium betulae]|uniref:16S rRNA pseudouridylate synthase n=1 Tax=Microbacterium betulae TaxID=2981139 RepID=A0AA97FIT4_9MICO|nr:hypothetical protein [Microbacterium sp. AB]WOF22312.1 hypothetical protein N8K70_13080 [Microbacterium sp. AB]
MPREIEAGEPLLTPFPRPNHIVLLRQERERRRRRRWAMGAAFALCLSAAGGSVAAAAAEPNPVPRSADEVTAAVSDPGALAAATEARENAQAAVDEADPSVDTSRLSAYVDELSASDKLPVVTVLGVVDDVEEEIDAVRADTEAAEQAAAEKAAAEKAAAEKAAAEKAAAEQAAAEQAAAEAAEAEAAEAAAGDNTVEGAQATARTMASEQYGWGDDQFSCLVSLWNRESGWSYTAMNASSGAYGIPQSLPGSKMASAGADWETNAATQIAWGLGYIASTYGTPCGAWSHSESTGWY